jgi:hypothetical protein
MNDEKKERKWEIHYKKKGWRQIFDTRSSRVVKNKTKPEEFDNEGGNEIPFPLLPPHDDDYYNIVFHLLFLYFLLFFF